VLIAITTRNATRHAHRRYVVARLDAGVRRRGEAKARTAERLIDEGLRMEDHPGIVFRDGPAGRRAALAGGPDAWEVIETLKAPASRASRRLPLRPNGAL
jgi:hypothetical protein